MTAPARRLTAAELVRLMCVLHRAKVLHAELAALEADAYAVTGEADRYGQTFEAVYGEGGFQVRGLLARLGLEVDADGPSACEL